MAVSLFNEAWLAVNKLCPDCIEPFDLFGKTDEEALALHREWDCDE
jgi:hypothetical protein